MLFKISWKEQFRDQVFLQKNLLMHFGDIKILIQQLKAF